MNGNQTLRIAGHISGFCARHLVALLVTVAVPCVLWTIVYLALLLWAVFTDGGIGSPLTYPVGLLFIVVAATVASLFLLFPSTVLAEWIASRLAYPVLAQVPLSIAILAALCFAVVTIGAAVGAQPSVRGVSAGFGILFVAHLLPLGLYWGAAQSGPLLLSLLRRLRRLLRP